MVDTIYIIILSLIVFVWVFSLVVGSIPIKKPVQKDEPKLIPEHSRFVYEDEGGFVDYEIVE